VLSLRIELTCVAKGQKLLSPSEYDAAVEYIDSSYNRVVASSVRAPTSLFSTSRPGDQLAALASEELVQLYTAKETPEFSAAPLFLWIQPQDASRSTLPEIGWRAVWEILTDGDWLRSVEKLNSALLLKDENTRSKVEEALDAHISLLSKMLTEFRVQRSGKFLEVTAAAIEAFAGEAIAEVLRYKFGLPLPPGSGAFAGWYAEWKAEAGGKGFTRWCSEGAIWRSIRREVKSWRGNDYCSRLLRLPRAHPNRTDNPSRLRSRSCGCAAPTSSSDGRFPFFQKITVPSTAPR
jgi:hypothetical protein